MALLKALTLNSQLTLKNRMIMAPMTRNRGIVPDESTATYYAQRASAGLILSEGTLISPQGTEWPHAPGIWSQQQVKAWKNVTDKVHTKGGKIFSQLWHVGRLTHPLNQDGKQPIGPSAIQAAGGKIQTKEGIKPYVMPREMTLAEIAEVINDFEKAALNAKTAGFDGVELHAAFGYLPNQFLCDISNQRKDKYGGSIENRCHFVLEVIDRLVKVWGNERVGIKLSPSNAYNTMKDSNPRALFLTLLKQLNEKKIAYADVMEGTEGDKKAGNEIIPAKDLKPHFTAGKWFVNQNYTFETGTAAIEKGEADAVVFGRLFLANPDLPERYKRGAKLNDVQWQFLYTGGKEGYTDYPTLEQLESNK